MYSNVHEMTESQIRALIDRDFDHWNDIAKNGCQDPHWPDGTNMDLVRTHIWHWYYLLAESTRTEQELARFLETGELEGERPIPPEVPNGYMVADGKYPNRLDGKGFFNLVWGKSGEYQA